MISARLATIIRPGSENFHGAIKGTNNVFNNIHHTRLEAVGVEFIDSYNKRYSMNLSSEWTEYNMLYIEFLVAISLYNRFHPKFSRTAPQELQVEIADRVLLLLSFPNLLLVPEIKWSLDVQLIPTPVRGLPGYKVFRFGDEQARGKLDLPELEEGDAWELVLLGTGPYTLRRSNSGLTSTREVELMTARRAGELGSLSEYNQLAALLPQSSPVFYFMQSDRPEGYKDEVFGPWPSNGVVILKLSIASSHKTPTNRNNMHTVTLAFAKNPPEKNPLRLRGHLSSLIAHACTCKSGSGTNRACAHVLAALTALCCPSAFRSPKKRSSRLSDIHRPAAHRPVMPGLTCAKRPRPACLAPAPHPPRRTPDTRKKFTEAIFQNYTGSGRFVNILFLSFLIGWDVFDLCYIYIFIHRLSQVGTLIG